MIYKLCSKVVHLLLTSGLHIELVTPNILRKNEVAVMVDGSSVE